MGLRKESDITITDEGRDKGKVFHLKEMPAAQLEWWGLRVFRSLEDNGVDVGNVVGFGIKGLQYLGVKALAKIPPAELKPLLDEMMGCVTIKPDPMRNPNFSRALLHADPVTGEGADIEEVTTFLTLRVDMVRMHLGFLIAGEGSKTEASPPAPASASPSPTIPIRRPPSRPASAPVRRP